MLMNNHIFSNLTVIDQVSNTHYVQLYIIYIIKSEVSNLYDFFHVYVYIRVIINRNRLSVEKWTSNRIHYKRTNRP